jgi:hypothetical protein
MILEAERYYEAIELACDLGTFAGAHAVYTPQPLVEEILGQIDLVNKDILVLFNVEFVVSLVYTYNVNPDRITFYSDSLNKNRFAVKIGVKYTDIMPTDMKFDVVVGNPPYQKSTNNMKRDSAANVWPEFVDKGEKLTKENGYFSFITPNGWITPSADVGKGKSGIRIFDYMRQYHTVVLNINECKRHFTEGSSFTYYIIHKKLNKENHPTVITTETEKFTADLSPITYCPSTINKLTLSINGKILKDSPIGFTNNNTADSKFFTQDIVEQPDKNHTTKCYHSSAANGTYYYSSYKGDLVNRPKVMVCSSGNYLPIYDDGQLGFTSKIYNYYLKDGETLESIRSYLESKIVKGVLLINKTSGWVSYAFRLLPRIDLTRIWTDAELYQHFGLTADEISYIESIVK